MKSQQQAPDPPRPWGCYTVPDDENLPVRVGPRDLWLSHRHEEIWLAAAPVAPDEGPNGPGPDPPDDGGWKRWATEPGRRDVRLVPAFPDRPVIVQPERSFHLVGGTSARVFVRVPLFIRVELGTGELLEEIPTVTMSDTWWGGFLEGELCYWLATTARRTWSRELLEPHLAVCPLALHNRSDGDLHVEKVAFRVMHLCLFHGHGGFWADETRVRYQGDVEGSQIDTTGRAPQEAAGAPLVAPPRVPAPAGLRARTFHRLWTFSSLGLGS